MLRRAVALSGLGALVLLSLVSQAGGARANGVPQLVKLTYLSGVSNWGPQDAEGVLEFSFAEAYARVDVKNLKPAAGITYEGWLTGGGGQPLLVGAIAPSSDGIGVLQTRLQGLKRYDYTVFVVAARGPNSATGQLPSDISIAGRFTVIQDTAGTPNPGDIQAGTGRPVQLPNTGQAVPPTTLQRLGRTFMVIAVAGGAAVIGVSFLRRRSRHD